MTVLIYVDTSKQVGDKDHLKVFANEDAMETWLAEHDPEDVAFGYQRLGVTGASLSVSPTGRGPSAGGYQSIFQRRHRYHPDVSRAAGILQR